jgi:hypothetical protein
MSSRELRSSLANFEAWLEKQEVRIQQIMNELARSSDLSSRSDLTDLKRLPLNRLVTLTDSEILSSKTVFAKCVTHEGKSLYDSKFDYHLPIGTIIREKDFEHSNRNCGKGIHLVLPCHVVRLAIMYHYLGQHDLKICFVTVPQVDPLDGTMNRIVKSNAFDKVQKVRVSFVQIQGFAMIDAFAMPQIPTLVIAELPDFKTVSSPLQMTESPDFKSFSIMRPKQTSVFLRETDSELRSRWDNLQTLYTRMCMTLNCTNLESKQYAHFFVELRKHLEVMLMIKTEEETLLSQKMQEMDDQIQRLLIDQKRKENLHVEIDLHVLPWAALLNHVHETQRSEATVLNLLLRRRRRRRREQSK